MNSIINVHVCAYEKTAINMYQNKVNTDMTRLSSTWSHENKTTN